MEKIEIYTSKKKSVLLLIGSLLFVILGIYMALHAEDFTRRSPLFVRTAAIAAILFFGIGIYVSIIRLVKNQLMFIIDSEGICMNPGKKSSKKIEWKSIEGFSEATIQKSKIIIIDMMDPYSWIEQEKNAFRKRLMEFNFNNYDSPFAIAASATNLSHAELINILHENWQKYSQQ